MDQFGLEMAFICGLLIVQPHCRVQIEGHVKVAQTGQVPMLMQMEVLGHLASLLVIKAIIQMEGIIAPEHAIQLPARCH
jgi:hypothetical protein